MTIGYHTITIKRGATWREAWTISGISDATGYSSRVDIRADNDPSADLVLTLTNGNARTALTIASGLKASHVISASDTTALTAGTYAFDWFVTAPTGDVTCYLTGSVIVEQSVAIDE